MQYVDKSSDKESSKEEPTSPPEILKRRRPKKQLKARAKTGSFSDNGEYNVDDKDRLSMKWNNKWPPTKKGAFQIARRDYHITGTKEALPDKVTGLKEALSTAKEHKFEDKVERLKVALQK